MLKIIEHPLLQQKLAKLRDERTDSTLFRRLTEKMTALLAMEATRHLETIEITVRTTLAETHGCKLARRVVCVPILRAGCGMEEGFRRVVPQASTGLIGLKRNETTLRPDQYYLNLPPHIEDADVFVVDPMLVSYQRSICSKIAFPADSDSPRSGMTVAGYRASPTATKSGPPECNRKAAGHLRILPRDSGAARCPHRSAPPSRGSFAQVSRSCCKLSVDTTLATGGSLVRALEVLRENGVTRLTVLTLISAPRGSAGAGTAVPRSTGFYRVTGRAAQRTWLYLPRAGRCRGSDFWND